MDNYENINKNSEIEVKFSLDNSITASDIITMLDSHKHSVWTNVDMEAIYFDTKNNDLQKENMAYRIRKEDGSIIATIKMKEIIEDGFSKRYEVNKSTMDLKPNINLFLEDKKIEPFIKDFKSEDLLPVMVMKFNRLKSIFKYQNSEIEIAIDRGDIVRYGKNIPIYELELELLDGDIGDLIRLKDFLIDVFDLKIDIRSKFKKGLDIIKTSS